MQTWMARFLMMLPSLAVARVVDFEVDGGAVPEIDTKEVWWANARALNGTLAALRPGDRLVIPNRTYHLMGGIRADNVQSITIQIDGTLMYADDTHEWPRDESRKAKDGRGKVYACWHGENWTNVTFTSSGTGTLNGNGATWWGEPGIGYLKYLENRPRLMSLKNVKSVLFERILMKNSPYWTFFMQNCDGLEVRHCAIDNRKYDKHDHTKDVFVAFNTDGFDVTGRNVWIHDSSVWTQDDCIAVKGAGEELHHTSENMLFERIEASGLGLTIGSMGGNSTVRNITFRDIYMHKTVKGIYAKFRDLHDWSATIKDVVWENIVMDEPSQYAIWIGPAQQSDSADPCAAHPCSLCWPQIPTAKCHAPYGGTYSNILLRNITVNSAKQSPGVIMANSANTMRDVVFEDVRFNNPGSSPFQGDYYYIKNVEGTARGNTWPIPKGFKDETCISDGSCTKNGRSCCSHDHHATKHCSSGHRCGCIRHGHCATHKSDCCSRKGHKTFHCSGGIGYRCEDGSQELEDSFV